MLEIKIKKLVENAVIPSYSKYGDAGMDLTATERSFDKYGNLMYNTGLAMEIPNGYVGLIFPRSSVSKLNLDLANAVGVIDAGYRGEIILKFKPTPQYVSNGVGVVYADKLSAYEVGDRVAQIIIMPRPEVGFMEVDELSDSERGLDGFGSTGK